MKLRVPKKIGKKTYEFEVEGENLFDVVMKAQKLSFDNVEQCGLCGCSDINLYAYIATGDFNYVKIGCPDCKASVTFGQKKKDDEVFYLRKTDDGKLKWEIIEPKK